jgi:hypothetical protein
MDSSYGKYMNTDIENTVIMEYSTFLPFIVKNFTVNTNTDFTNYVQNTPQLLYYFADLLMFNLPSPRYKFYESTNFEQIQNSVTAQTNLV